MAPFFVFDEEAGILDDGETGGAGFFSGGGVFYAQLEPEDFGIDGDGRNSNRRHIFGAAEDVDDVDGFGYIFEARVGFFAQDFGFVGIDRDDAVAARLHVRGDAVARPRGLRGQTHHDQRPVLLEHRGDGVRRGRAPSAAPAPLVEFRAFRNTR